MKRYFEMAVLAVTLSAPVYAQDNGQLASRSLTIEGTYNPTVTEAGKIMPVPEKIQNTERKVSVSYLRDPSPYPGLVRKPMSVLAAGSDDVTYPAFSGFTSFSYGLRNIHDGLADVQWRISDKDILRLYGNLDAWNSKPDGNWQSHMFDCDANAAYTHQFKGFSAGFDASAGLRRYNYRRGELMDSAAYAGSKLMQLTTTGEIGAFVKSDEGGFTSWHLGIRGQWLNRDGLKVNGVTRSNKERLVRVSGGFTTPLEEGVLGLEYRQKSAAYTWTALNGGEYRNYSEFTISPFWSFEKDELQVSVGLNLDLRTSQDGMFPVSPNMGLVYSFADNWKLVAGMRGGVEDYDMRHLAAISPYWSEEKPIHDGYTVFDGSVGVVYEPEGWASVSLDGGFRFTQDEVFQVAADSMIVTSVMKQQEARVLYLKLDADMHFSDKALLRFDAVLADYLGAYMGYKMQLKPAFDLKAYGRFNITKGVDAVLSYRLMLFNKVAHKSMPAVNDLSLSASYEFRKNLSFNLSLQRIVGSDYYYYAGYRSLKPAFLLGATYRF